MASQVKLSRIAINNILLAAEFSPESVSLAKHGPRGMVGGE